MLLLFFASQTDIEFMKKYGTYQSTNRAHDTEFKPLNLSSGYPDSMDWRTKGAVTEIKNQVNVCTIL